MWCHVEETAVPLFKDNTEWKQEVGLKCWQILGPVLEGRPSHESFGGGGGGNYPYLLWLMWGGGAKNVEEN
jgi:hypothetical protein